MGFEEQRKAKPHCCRTRRVLFVVHVVSRSKRLSFTCAALERFLERNGRESVDAMSIDGGKEWICKFCSESNIIDDATTSRQAVGKVPVNVFLDIKRGRGKLSN